ncbi:uncharacterized protein G2W53_036286 [Senna tora]|uniref:Uncharacterized protein n=1 Tax=Senna tora TaxID=362788 RepID=A0A834SSB1_9FABA|nr:uncharacterized protein G2W53_036286 [Senna tora]
MIPSLPHIFIGASLPQRAPADKLLELISIAATKQETS